MRQPSDKAIRAALLRWAIGQMRWMEIQLADSDSYTRILPELADRKKVHLAATAALIVIGNRLLLAPKPKEKVRRG